MRRSMVAWMGIGMAAIGLALGASACAEPKCPPETPEVKLKAEEAPRPAEAEGGGAKEPEGQAKAEPELKGKKRTYYMVLLRRGAAWELEETPEWTSITRAHIEHTRKMAKSGALLVAGPFMDARMPTDLAGVLILGVATLDEAKALAEADPAVKAGRFTVEVKPWITDEGLRVNP